MYTYLTNQLQTRFDIVRVYRESSESDSDGIPEGKYIARVRHKETKESFIVRRFTGDPACYEKLLPVKSPYLPEIYEVASSGEHVLVLEEFIEGDLVSAMLADTLFSEKETVSIALDICQALSVLHSLDIVHRDVKPENIILRDSKAVLFDFDAARIHKDPYGSESNETDTRLLGTTGFAAPEQFGISQSDVRSDIFALGVTMNILLTGKHPSQQLAKGRLGRIISTCTMMQPGKRYPNVQKLMEVLQT